MISKQEFKKKIADDIEEEIYNLTGKNIICKEAVVKKPQKKSYEGLSFSEDGKAGIILDVLGAYGKLENGDDYNDILSDAVHQIASFLKKIPDGIEDMFNDYSQIRTRLFMQLIQFSCNEDYLKNVPYTFVARNLVVIYRISCSGFIGNTVSSGIIDNNMLQRWNIDKDQLHHDAMNSAPVNSPAKIQSLWDFMTAHETDDVLHRTDNEETSLDPGLYIATTESATFGASVIAYPGFLEKAAQAFGRDFFILPSSIHEVLLLPDDGAFTKEMLSEMVKTVNRTEVAPEDRLSDDVYYYERELRNLRIA